MDWNEILQSLFTVVLIPLLGLIAKYLIVFINTKVTEIKNKTDNETLNKYLTMLQNTVEDCVIATNQTYVEALKDQNAFTAEAQKEAFNKTYKAVMDILTDDAEEYLQNGVKDLETYIKTLIESQVNLNKTTPAVITEE